MAGYSVVESTVNSPMIDLLLNCQNRIGARPPKGRRYTDKEKDFFTYRYIQGGKELYQLDEANSVVPGLRTVQRHLKTMSSGVEPECLRIESFVQFLEMNNLPKAFVLSEDATRITGGFGYDAARDQVYGLVPPVDENGMPFRLFFPASSPQKVVEYIKKYPIGRNLYVTMAQPLQSGAPSFCLMFCCSDNKFSTKDILRKWRHIENECSAAGLDLICRAADGDPRIVPGMLQKMCIPCTEPNPFGTWYVAKYSTASICVQDPPHLLNKFKTRLLKVEKRLILGTFNATFHKHL